MVSVICCTCQSTCAVVTPIMCIRGSGRMCRAMLALDCRKKESMFAVSCIRALTGRTRADRASSLSYGNSCSRRTGVCGRLKVRMLAVNAGPHWHASHLTTVFRWPRGPVGRRASGYFALFSGRPVVHGLLRCLIDLFRGHQYVRLQVYCPTLVDCQAKGRRSYRIRQIDDEKHVGCSECIVESLQLSMQFLDGLARLSSAGWSRPL